MTRRPWLRLRYWKQIRKGFGLLKGKAQELQLVDGRDFISRLTDDKKTMSVVNKKYDWDAVTTINVYTVKTDA